MIEVQNLGKTFKVHKKESGFWGSVKSVVKREWVQKEALRDITFRIGENEIVGLVGANGAGKTTLVKILSGIIHPTRGQVKVLNHIPWERDDSFRRQMSLIMGQKASLWWDLPAADCFLLLREIYQIPWKNFRENLGELTERLHIKDHLNVPIRRLSLGERMKLELVAALLHRPKVIFLDEPTIGLDLSAQKAIREFLLDYQKERHPSMIVTSHYMEDIARLCKRILIVKEGGLIYDGPLSAVTGRYNRHKIISVHREGPQVTTIPSELGQVIFEDDVQLKIKVIREKVAEAAAYCLQNLRPIDLSIEEPDISEVIEVIIKEGL